MLRKPPMPIPPDPGQAVAAALDAPIGSMRIEQEARGCRSACLLVCDITRPVPNNLLLRPIVERLIGAGMDPAGITVIVATGLHRPNLGSELDRLIGDPWVRATVKVENHFARNDEDHVLLGTTRLGIPVAVDRRFASSELRIAVGLVEPHFMAGYSGGRKLVLPGIARADTIRAFHAARMIGHPKAASCSLDGNPIHETQLEAMRLLGRAFSMNVVIDEQRRLAFASFGGMEESHAAAVRFAGQFARVSVARRFPVVLSSAAGYPLDATYYQTIKGICGAAPILEPGGDLFVVSECSEGFGSAEFLDAQNRLCELGKERFREEAMSRERALIDEWQTVMLLKALEIGNVHLYSGRLTGSQARATGVASVADLKEALRACVARDPERRLAVIPEGPYVEPFVEGEQ